MKLVYLSLGSNLGDRQARLERAVKDLGAAGVRVLRLSSYYRTEPVDFQAQPWFLNCAAEAETELMPLQLLRSCKSAERAGGRRPGVAGGPRTIDIDILLYENVVISTTELSVPHKRLAERRFVLAPLCEIAPDLRDPVSRRTAQELLQQTPDKSQVVRIRGAFHG